MKFKKQILELLSSPDYIPIPAKSVASALGIHNQFLRKELDQSLGRLLQQVVLGPEALYRGDNLRFMAVAMGDDPG